MSRLPILKQPAPETCTCDTCKDMCYRPCWPTPDEAQRLIDAGHLKDLALDTYYIGGQPVEVLRPQNANDSERRCIFQDRETLLCRVHGTDLKPIEGRLAHHELIETGKGAALRRAIAKLWKNKKGRELIEQWIDYKLRTIEPASNNAAAGFFDEFDAAILRRTMTAAHSDDTNR